MANRIIEYRPPTYTEAELNDAYAKAVAAAPKGANYVRMLAPPEHARRVDVPFGLVRIKLLDGYIADPEFDDRPSRRATLPGLHEGRTAIVVASGPSAGSVDPVKLADFINAQDAVVWGTNNAFNVVNGFPLPKCNYLTILDQHFYHANLAEILKFARERNTTLCTCFDVHDFPNVHPLDIPLVAAGHANAKPKYAAGRYFNGESSGVAAVQMALHAGCKTIYLLGHDLCAHQGKTHGNGARTSGELKGNYPQSALMRAGYALLCEHAAERGASIVNLSPFSSLEGFPKQNLLGI